MADQNIDFAGARNAWGRLYVRHHSSLLDICRYEYGYLLGREEARDLVNDAFVRAFDGATSFDHAEACDAIVQERKTRKWLARIAENLVRDRHRGQPEVRLVDDEDLERLGGATDDSPSQIQVPESKRLKLLKSGFALLSDTEQTVLRATMFWWQADQKHQRMPHTAMEQLSKQVGKSPANIRQIRLRAVKEIEKYVNENLHNEKAD
ncbi:MAG: sigma-70 family RNA polymerase sigma factor [Candidatus Sulfotelmatobacter sp.]